MIKESKILIVDENEETYSLYINKFNKCKLTFVNNSWQALMKAQQSSYDIIIVDISLSDLSGVALITKIRELHNDVPVVVISSKELAKKLPLIPNFIQAVVSKPIDFCDLKVKVKEQLQELPLDNSLLPLEPICV